MAAYRRVYDSRHLQADCHELGSSPEPYARNRVWATFYTLVLYGRPYCWIPVLATPLYNLCCSCSRQLTVHCVWAASSYAESCHFRVFASVLN